MNVLNKRLRNPSVGKTFPPVDDQYCHHFTLTKL